MALAGVITELKHLKKQPDKLITSEYYLDRVPDVLRKGGSPDVRLGQIGFR
jgi:hypothetical protein